MSTKPNSDRLTDLSPMPYVVHKDKPMQDVPADYLHYLWTHGMSGNRVSIVAIYIRENLTVLAQENPDLIWK